MTLLPRLRTFAACVTVAVALAFLPSVASADDSGADRLAGARSLKATSPVEVAQANPCNPCAGMNPCNPCGGKNPCNPCGGKNPCNPCGGNPCNPCGGGKVDPALFKQPAGAKLHSADRARLVADGEKLWNDRSLGKTGLACATCHFEKYAQMKPTFAKAYPHTVAMPKQQAGVEQVNAAEMVNFCMIVPMGDDPLAWDSHELAALSAYVESIQGDYHPVSGSGANPCNPCGGNPCNPCGAGNPCNPCGAKNPCNPCGG